MIRVVVVVAAAVALVGAAAPVIADARVQTTEDRLAIQGERIGAMAGELISESTAVKDPTLAGRRSITVQIPTGFTAAPIEDVMLTCRGIATDWAESGASRGDLSRASSGAASPAPTGAARTPGNATGDGSSSGSEACEAVISYRIQGQARRAVPIPGVQLATTSGPTTLSTGATRLTLRLISGDQGPVITVERV